TGDVIKEEAMERTVESSDRPAAGPVETAAARRRRAAAGAGWCGSRRTRRATMVRVARAGVGGAGVAGLAACGKGASGQAGGGVKAPSGPVEMEFLHFFTGVLWDNGFKPIIDAFEQKYPNIRWKGTAIPYGEMHTKIVTLVAGGTPPDGMSVPSDRAAEPILRRVLPENDPYVAKDKSVPIADVYPARLLNYKLADKLYALPIDNGSEAVYYNKELFDKAGVPYPKNDWTWDDLLDKARRLTRTDDPTRPVYGF